MNLYTINSHFIVVAKDYEEAIKAFKKITPNEDIHCLQQLYAGRTIWSAKQVLNND